MAFLKAVVITGILLAFMLITMGMGLDTLMPIIAVSALWCGYDSFAKGLYRYETGLPKNPIGVTIAVSLLWIIGFPWYLVVRSRLSTGTLKAVAAAA